MNKNSKNVVDFQLAILEMFGLSNRPIVELNLKIRADEIPELTIIENIIDFNIDTKKINTIIKKFELKEIE